MAWGWDLSQHGQRISDCTTLKLFFFKIKLEIYIKPTLIDASYVFTVYSGTRPIRVEVGNHAGVRGQVAKQHLAVGVQTQASLVWKKPVPFTTKQPKGW